MNYRNAVSRYQGDTLKTRTRSGSTRRRKATNPPPEKLWFKSGGASPDYDLQEVVAQRFMSMNQEHDRIRTKLLGGRELPNKK